MRTRLGGFERDPSALRMGKEDHRIADGVEQRDGGITCQRRARPGELYLRLHEIVEDRIADLTGARPLRVVHLQGEVAALAGVCPDAFEVERRADIQVAVDRRLAVRTR